MQFQPQRYNPAITKQSTTKSLQKEKPISSNNNKAQSIHKQYPVNKETRILESARAQDRLGKRPAREDSQSSSLNGTKKVHQSAQEYSTSKPIIHRITENNSLNAPKKPEKPIIKIFRANESVGQPKKLQQSQEKPSNNKEMEMKRNFRNIFVSKDFLKLDNQNPKSTEVGFHSNQEYLKPKQFEEDKAFSDVPTCDDEESKSFRDLLVKNQSVSTDSPIANSAGPKGLDYTCLMKPSIWDEEKNLTGWYMTERILGVKCFWDGAHLWSDQGSNLNPPSQFTENFPKMSLEGILHGGRGNLMKWIYSTRKDHQWSEQWEKANFVVLDIPTKDERLVFELRLRRLREIFQSEDEQIRLANYKKVKNQEHLMKKLQKIQSSHGQGIIVKNPSSSYSVKKSDQAYLEAILEYPRTATLVRSEYKQTEDGLIFCLVVRENEGDKILEITEDIPEEVESDPPSEGSEIMYKLSPKTTPGEQRSLVFLGVN